MGLVSDLTSKIGYDGFDISCIYFLTVHIFLTWMLSKDLNIDFVLSLNMSLLYTILIYRGWGEYDKFNKILTLFPALCLWLTTIGAFFIVRGQIILGLGSIFSIFTLPLLLPVVLYLLVMLEVSKSHRTPVQKLAGAIISYIIIAIFIIFTFTFLFLTSTAFNDSLVFDTGEKLNQVDLYNHGYFSALVFYSNTIGDIKPIGISKMLVVVELAFSVIIHVVILGKVISDLGEKGTRRPIQQRRRKRVK